VRAGQSVHHVVFHRVCPISDVVGIDRSTARVLGFPLASQAKRGDTSEITTATHDMIVVGSRHFALQEIPGGRVGRLALDHRGTSPITRGLSTISPHGYQGDVSGGPLRPGRLVTRGGEHGVNGLML
jgi:hypothetical protein